MSPRLAVESPLILLLLATAAVALSAPQLGAQEGRELQVAGGFAVSFAPDQLVGDGPIQGGEGVGASLVGEYVFAPAGWGGGRLYLGGVFTSAREDSCSGGVDPCSVSSRLAVVGGKVRLLVPIPYVGPFFEVGAGLSVGTIESRLGPFGTLGPVDEDHAGVMFHVPFALGLAFGSRHQHEVSFSYFAHPGRNHLVGSIQVGVGFTHR